MIDTSGICDNHFAAVDSLRDRIFALEGFGEGVDWDWSVVKQAELRTLGSSSAAEPAQITLGQTASERVS